MKRVVMKDSPGLPAGAGKLLLEGIEYLMQRKVATLGDTWQMASVNVFNMLKENCLKLSAGYSEDRVLFNVSKNEIAIFATIKNGKIIIVPE